MPYFAVFSCIAENNNVLFSQMDEEIKNLPEDKKNSFWDFIKFVLVAVLVVIPFRLWVAQPFIVSGASMEPTFENGDYLIVDEFSYHFRAPKKGEVIVFRYPLDPSKFFIKRIEGVPGETVVIGSAKIILGEKEYFVLGDNRSASSDSRVWGNLTEKFIVGRALVRLWPLNEIGLLLKK